MENSFFKVKRKSVMELGEIYFWTATIHKWIPLLQTDSAKDMILNSLKYLSTKDKIDVYAFVIMPNHIHLIWKLNALNGKELPHASFLKFTAHAFKAELIKTPEKLSRFFVDEGNKEFNFWQRDSLAVKLTSREMAFQKMDYIHKNPLADHWNLATRPEDYLFSSASFYEKGEDRFGVLKDIREEF